MCLFYKNDFLKHAALMNKKVFFAQKEIVYITEVPIIYILEFNNKLNTNFSSTNYTEMKNHWSKIFVFCGNVFFAVFTFLWRKCFRVLDMF